MIQDDRLVSVIIPVYNVEKYINECLSSVVNQSYKNIEILLVDDGGQDSSMQIARDFSKIDNRIKLLSYGRNMGVSFARNYGLLNSNGEYVYFMDSDDFIDNGYLEEMVKNIDDFDVIQNNHWIEYVSPKKSNTVIYGNEISPAIWNKLYKKDFLTKNNIKFPEGIKIGEDLCFNYNCILLTDKVKYCYLNTNYFYRQSETSTLKRYKKENDILAMFYILYDMLKHNKALDKVPLPLYHLRRHLKVANNKNKMFGEIKEFFTKIQNSINIQNYRQKDILFFNCILTSQNVYQFLLKFIFKKLSRTKE